MRFRFWLPHCARSGTPRRRAGPWEQLSQATPLFYVVDAVRYGFLGTSEVGAPISFAVLAAITLALLAWAQYLFTSGRKLKP